MSEAGEDLRTHRQQIRRDRLARNMEILRKKGVGFTVKNGGYHLIFRKNGRRVDYWPSGGKFMVDGKVSPGGPAAVLRALHGERSPGK